MKAKHFECGSDMVRSTCWEGNSASNMGLMGQNQTEKVSKKVIAILGVREVEAYTRAVARRAIVTFTDFLPTCNPSCPHPPRIQGLTLSPTVRVDAVQHRPTNESHNSSHGVCFMAGSTALLEHWDCGKSLLGASGKTDSSLFNWTRAERCEAQTEIGSDVTAMN